MNKEQIEQRIREEQQIFEGLMQFPQGKAFIEHIKKRYMTGACFKETDRETNYTLGRRDFAALIVESAEKANV